MSEPTPQLSPSDLCQSCGICCDGTLFAKVTLQPDDVLEPLRLAGITVTSDETGGRFALACAAHQGGCCQVYPSRPSNCRSYQCKLLRRFTKGAVTWAQAAAQISHMRDLRAQLGKEVERRRPGMGRAGVAEISRLVPPFATLTSDRELHTYWAPVLLRLVALRRFALDVFHAPRSQAEPEHPQQQG